MSLIPWFQAVDLIEPHLVLIATPDSQGSGFLFWNGELCGIATAAHVVEEAERWMGKPIQIYHPSTEETKILQPNDRKIYLDSTADIAAILFEQSDARSPFPEVPLDLIPEDEPLRVGDEIGWIGFPYMTAPIPCFFSGRISALVYGEQKELEGCFVDGAAINGVSGGPAFSRRMQEENAIWVIGVVSEYWPNLGVDPEKPLPGLLVVRPVAKLRDDVISPLKSLDQAKKLQPSVTSTSLGSGHKRSSHRRHR